MTTLEDLWYGNIRPVEEFLADNKEYKELLRIVAKNRERLESTLNSEQAELFEKYYATSNKMNSVSEAAAFRCGFTLATEVFIEIK